MGQIWIDISQLVSRYVSTREKFLAEQGIELDIVIKL